MERHEIWLKVSRKQLSPDVSPHPTTGCSCFNDTICGPSVVTPHHKQLQCRDTSLAGRPGRRPVGGGGDPAVRDDVMTVPGPAAGLLLVVIERTGTGTGIALPSRTKRRTRTRMRLMRSLEKQA